MPTVTEEMRAFWNGPPAERWVRLQPALDEGLEPFGRAIMDAVALEPGARVLDVGCGTGATVIELSSRVGSAGHVTGLDLSEPMLEVARERVRAAGLTNVDLVAGDAATHAFEPGSVDAVVSRFGWMFFEDPVAALANVRRAARPRGRAALVTWRQLADNPWANVPLAAAVRIIGPVKPPKPGAPGPFALADEGRVRTVMESAGWEEVSLARFDPMMTMGQTASLDEAVELAMQIGPTARALIDAGATQGSDARERVREVLRETLAPLHGPNGVLLGTSAWVVTARAP